MIVDGQNGIHGTWSRYRAGCRCHDCRAENTRRGARDKARRIVRLEHDAKTIVHGSTGYKNHGCRCDDCKFAKRVENARRYV